MLWTGISSEHANNLHSVVAVGVRITVINLDAKGWFYSESTDMFVVLIIFLSFDFEIVSYKIAQIMSNKGL